MFVVFVVKMVRMIAEEDGFRSSYTRVGSFLFEEFFRVRSRLVLVLD